MEIQENVSLAPFTTLRIGGPARYFARVTSEAEIAEAVEFARERKLKLFVLGGGSNLVVADAGFAGLVVQVAIGGPIFTDVQHGSSKVHYHVPAGMDWDALVAETCRAELTGIECLAGIPGTVGGSPVQNIGAYGQEVAQTIHSVHAYDRDMYKFVTLTAEECRFGYRRSIFNTSHKTAFTVTRVAFEFDVEARPRLEYPELRRYFEGNAEPTPMEVSEAVRAIRDRKGMLIDSARPGPDSRSAGSFFKNPVVAPGVSKRIAAGLGIGMEATPHWPAEGGSVKLSAAWLIERAGFSKGFQRGRVGISSRHTLALVNRAGDATCEELLRLRDLIADEVKRQFGVELEQEPVMLA